MLPALAWHVSAARHLAPHIATYLKSLTSTSKADSTSTIALRGTEIYAKNNLATL